MGNIHTKIRKPKNPPFAIGIGYIYIHEDVDRDLFINDCFQKERFSIFLEHGSVIKDCYATKEAIKNIKFSNSVDKLGTPIVYVFNQTYTKPIIIGTVPQGNGFETETEGIYRQQISFKDNNALLSLDPKTGLVSLNLDMFDEKTAELHITISSKTNTKVKLSHNGTTEIYSKQKVDITTDEFLSTNTKSTFLTDEFIIKEGSEPMVLGDKIATFLSDLIEEISKATVSTMLGTQPLLNAAQILAFQQRVDEFKSEIGKLD